MIIAFDTETYLIRGANIPPLICLSYAECEGADWKTGVKRGDDAKTYLKTALKQHTLVAHNAAFDLPVISRAWPDLIPLIFDALRGDRIRDTRIREQLHKIAHGGSGEGALFADGVLIAKSKLSLSALTYKYLNLDISSAKAGSTRYSYDQLEDVPLEDWDQESIDYAAQDALLTGLVYFCQQAEIDAEELLDECAQVRADYALSLMAREGIKVDPDALDAVKSALQAEADDIAVRCRRAGYMSASGSMNTKKIADRVDQILSEKGIDVPKTSTGAVSTGRDALELTQDPDLLDVDAYRKTTKLLTTYVNALESAAEYEGILRAEYDVLKKTGRTSCKRPNLQNLPRRGGVRDCFVPRSDDRVLVLCDYDAAEMRTLAQCYFELCGKMSPLGTMYADDPDFDPHSYLGAQLLGISYQEMLERVEAGDAEAKDTRQRAKPANFGYAGGMGASAFISYARGYGVELSEADAQELRDVWIQTYDMGAWFKEAQRAHDSGVVVCPSSQRRRGRPRYTEAANMPFQGMAADGAKQALFEVARECWAVKDSPLFKANARPLVFVHDEIIIEADLAQAHEAATRLSEIMVEQMECMTPNIPARATPAIAHRWLKGAKPVFDENGRLVPYRP